MGALLRRLMRALLLVSVLGAVGIATAVVQTATAASLPSASSATPGVPTSTVQAVRPGTVKYCVTGYAPNSDVAVLDKTTGSRTTIHTDANGAGCANIPVKTACSSSVSQTITATGKDSDGNAASSQVVYNAPPNPNVCASRSPKPRVGVVCTATQAILHLIFHAHSVGVRGHACGFLTGETVFGYVHSTPTFIGSTTADDRGVATMQVELQACLEPGDHTFMLVGQSSGTVATAPFTLSSSQAASDCGTSTAAGGGIVLPVSANGGSVGAGTGGSGGGSLAFTGADILAMVLVALVLLALGAAALVTARRRRTA